MSYICYLSMEASTLRRQTGPSFKCRLQVLELGLQRLLAGTAAGARALAATPAPVAAAAAFLTSEATCLDAAFEFLVGHCVCCALADAAAGAHFHRSLVVSCRQTGSSLASPNNEIRLQSIPYVGATCRSDKRVMYYAPCGHQTSHTRREY